MGKAGVGRSLATQGVSHLSIQHMTIQHMTVISPYNTHMTIQQDNTIHNNATSIQNIPIDHNTTHHNTTYGNT